MQRICIIVGWSWIAVLAIRLMSKKVPLARAVVQHSGCRVVVLRLTRDQLWAATFTAVYQRLRLFASSS